MGALSLGLGIKTGSLQVHGFTCQPFKDLQPRRRAYSYNLGAGPNVVVDGEVVGGRGLEREVPYLKQVEWGGVTVLWQHPGGILGESHDTGI